MALQTIILAGGLGTRLGPLTKNLPKALIDISGKSFISRQLEHLHSQGIKDVIICTGFLGDLIKKEISKIKPPLNIEIRNDGNKLKGTGGAIKSCLDILDDHFFVTWGDTHLPICLEETERDFLEQNKPCLMTLLKNLNQWDASNVIYKSGLVEEYNKKDASTEMEYIDYGISVFSKKIFEEESLPDIFDLGDLVSQLAGRREIAGKEVKKRFYEIGSPEGLKETQDYFLMLDSLKKMINEKGNIFLDRDGVINEVISREGVISSPRKISEFKFRTEIFRFMSHLKKKNIFIVTNQPDISRELMPQSELEKINEIIKENLEINEIVFCPHGDDNSCDCRKPKPGMINSLIDKYSLDRGDCLLIGDSQKDIGAAQAANIDSILLKTNYNNFDHKGAYTEALTDLI